MSASILLTGGSGLLGRHLLALEPSIDAPTRADMNIADLAGVRRALEKTRPATVIHAAAMTISHEVNANPAEAVLVNIGGTANVAAACIERGIRLVYISTDYLYTDTPGPHREDEPLQPANLYAWTKLGGEAAVMLVPGSLIIRTTFGPNPCQYDRAAEDKVTSKQYVEDAAPQILELAKSTVTGVINLGGEPVTMLEYARRTRPDARGVKLADLKEPIPRDSSLDLARWKKFRSSGS